MFKGQKRPGSIVAEIKMTRMVHAGPIVVVEGPSDEKFWKSHCRDDCELIACEGKTNVVGSIQRLDRAGFSGALGIVDDDFDSIRGMPTGSVNLVATDAHDLECLLCRSPALGKVLSEFGDREKIRRFEGDEGLDVRAALLERSVVFGQVRWAIAEFGLDADVGAIRVPRFVEVETWEINRQALYEAVDRGGGLDKGEGLKRCVSCLPSVDPWRVANGHEMLQILSLGLRGVLGNTPREGGSRATRFRIACRVVGGSTLGDWHSRRYPQLGAAESRVRNPCSIVCRTTPEIFRPKQTTTRRTAGIHSGKWSPSLRPRRARKWSGRRSPSTGASVDPATPKWARARIIGALGYSPSRWMPFPMWFR